MYLRSLPVGAKLIDASGVLSFLIAAQDHPGYNGTTLISERVVRVAPFDAREPENPAGRGFDNIKEFGNNDFPLSNLYQWLNAKGHDWYKPAHQWDAPPAREFTRHGANTYIDTAGFLSRLSDTLLQAILTSSVPVIRKSQGGTFQVKTFPAKVFLPSRTEIGLGNESGFPEGKPLPLFRDFRIREARLTEEAGKSYNSPWWPGMYAPGGAAPSFPADSTWRWWLRTPHTRYAYLVRYFMGRDLSYAPAFSDIVGVRPMMNVSSELVVSDKGEDGNIYRITEGV